MVALDREFIALVRAGDSDALEQVAVDVRQAYLTMADATDEYRAALRESLGEQATPELLAPYRKQARGLRIAAKGVEQYRTALVSGETGLAKSALRKMARGEALMKQAGAELDAATGQTGRSSTIF